MLTKDQEAALQELNTMYENGMYPEEEYIKRKKEIMGADYSDDSPASAPSAAAVVPTELPMMNISEAAPAAIKYNVRVDNKEIGVFDREVLFKMIENGDIDKDAMVWRKDYDDWKIAFDVPELEERFPAEPPPGSKAYKRRKDAEAAKIRAEEKVKADERDKRLAEERRKADEQRRIEDQRKENEKRIADEQRRAAEQRQAEERRRAQEQRRLDEEARRTAASYSSTSSSSSSSSRPSYNYSSSYDAEDVFSVIFGVILGLIGGAIVGLIVGAFFNYHIAAIIIGGLLGAVGIFFLVKFWLFEEHPIITTIITIGAVAIVVLIIISNVDFSKSNKDDNNGTETVYEHAYQTGIVTGVSSLNLREGPSTNHNIVTTLREGSIVHIRGDAVGNWLPVFIEKDDGTAYEGFVGSGYIKIND